MEQRENINCNVVRDLLPLYADSVLSPDSAAIVDAHLPQCPPCTAELESLRAPVPAKKKSARQSLKASRRKLVLSIGAALLAIVALLAATAGIGRKDSPVPYSDGLFEPIFAFHATANDPTGEGDFLHVQLARQPMFEFNGVGETWSEDVVTINGARVGVLYIQVMKSPRDIWISNFRARFHGGRNPMIVGYGSSSYQLSPMSEKQKADFRAWETEATGSALAVEDEANFANWARDIPITRLYYYGGPAKNLVNEALGWSERNGVLADSVLLWDAETDAQDEPYPAYFPETKYGETTAPPQDWTTSPPQNQ